MGENELKEIIKDNVHINIIDGIFQNPYFNEVFLGILQSNRAFRESKKFKSGEGLKEKLVSLDFDKKQIINTALCLPTFILASTIEYVTPETILYFRKRFQTALRRTKEYQEGTFTLTDACFALYDVALDSRYNFISRYSQQLDLDFMLKRLIMARCLIGAILLIIPQNNAFQLKLKEIVRNMDSMEEGKKFSITKALTDINNIIKKIDRGLDYLNKTFSNACGNQDMFTNFVNTFSISNEKNILYILNQMTSNFHYQGPDIKFYEIISQKINNTSQIKEDINKFARKNLQAFRGEVNETDIEWSNKIYLISYKTLSIFETIKDAVDEKWKVDTAVYELRHWIEDIHKVINKYDIEDDWEKISKFLGQENKNVEWKSTFFTPTEEPFIDNETEKQVGEKVLSNLIKVMLGMINSDGGIILVGVVERPDMIVRDEVRNNLIKKNGRIFFNVKYELSKRNKNLDEVKRLIQDRLCIKTDLTVDKFNGLWSIEPIEIKSDGTTIEIYKLEIKRAEPFIYNIEKRNEVILVGLTKRADGRTVFVDPREHLRRY